MIFALALFGLTIILIWCSNKEKQINSKNYSKQDLQVKEIKTQKAADEIVVNSEQPIQRVNDISDLNAIVYLNKIDNKE